MWGNPALYPTRGGRRFWLTLGVSAGVALLLASFAIRGTAFRETLRYTLQGLALFPVFIAAIRYSNWGFFRVLNWGWVRRLGVWSYSFYLTHSIIIACVQQWLMLTAEADGRTRFLWLVLQGVVAFAASLLTSALIYRVVEKPCARLRQRLARVFRPANPAPAPRVEAKDSKASTVFAGSPA